MPTSDTHAFAGRRRNRSTHWSVTLKDRLARTIIMVGGLGTILAVSTVCLFLIAVVIPLFRAPEAEMAGVAPIPTADRAGPAGTAAQAAPAPTGKTASNPPLHVAVDEYNLMAWAVLPDGVVHKFRLDTGEVLDTVPLTDGPALTAWSFPQRDEQAVLGYADGTVRFATIQFVLRFIELDDAPEALRALAVGEIASFEKGLAQRTPERQIRHVTLNVSLDEPLPTGSNHPVIRLNHTGTRNEVNYAAMTADGRLFVQRARGRRNLLTQQIVYRTQGGEVDYQARNEPPAWVTLTGLGDNLYLIWRDGILHRYDTRDLNHVFAVETVDLSPEAGVTIETLDFMIGKTTLLVGDRKGALTGWFRVRPDGIEHDPELTVTLRAIDFDAQGQNRGAPQPVRVADIETPDALALVPVKHFAAPPGNAPVTALASSQRKRMFTAGYADGRIRVFNATIQRLLLDKHLPDRAPVDRVRFNPRDNGLIGIGGGGVTLWHLDAPHSEASWAGYFRPIWYEGYAEPRHVWQSTGGTDDFESKFGIMPLVFGTVKATVYSMLFAIPLALLGAIFTSEFLHPRIKARIKPTIEMMASLPSVVLGFLAGLVVAQFVESRVPAVLMALLTLPFTLLVASYCWQMLSRAFQMRFTGLRFPLMLLAIPVAIWLAGVVGPRFERTFFEVEILDAEVAAQLVAERDAADVEHGAEGVVLRDFRTWLSAHRQDAADPIFRSRAIGGWLILITPLCLLVSAFCSVRFVNPWLLQHTRRRSRLEFALLDFARFLLVGLGGLLLALVLAWLLGLVADPRGGVLDQYVQRNALIVGFIMGFAVVPIIYTIADDALSAVPEHLRSASLGAGATRWQTAVRIIVPTAMSGLFSAVMIGFGRAVGETMIVLMAAGNTPIMEWNLFSGFRTLSANIAVEMMEAVEGSTNYRTLFLAAVMLFGLTFVINTLAETVRMRYRRRAFEL